MLKKYKTVLKFVKVSESTNAIGTILKTKIYIFRKIWIDGADWWLRIIDSDKVYLLWVLISLVHQSAHNSYFSKNIELYLQNYDYGIDTFTTLKNIIFWKKIKPLNVWKYIGLFH